MTRDCGHTTDDQTPQTFGEQGGWVPKFDRSCPLCSLVGHVTGPRRLKGHSQST
ncbi:unnamed protein product, partial [Staurois parvus]